MKTTCGIWWRKEHLCLQKRKFFAYRGHGILRVFVLGALIALLLLTTARAAAAIRVFVSIAPQKYFIQKIGADLAQTHIMVAAGASPATYEPSPRQMAALSKARVYFAIGVPFEKRWLKKIAAANPSMRVVHTDQGINKIPMQILHQHDAAKNGPKIRTRGSLDPHIWLAPRLVKLQAGHILNALLKIDPSRRVLYETNHGQFIRELEALDREIQEDLAEKKGLRFMVFHPAWGYFAQAYGLEQIPIELEGKAPKPAQLKALIKHAKQKEIRVIFVQPQFSSKSAAVVAKAIGAKVVFLDPLAADWVENLRTAAKVIRSVLK